MKMPPLPKPNVLITGADIGRRDKQWTEHNELLKQALEALEACEVWFTDQTMIGTALKRKAKDAAGNLRAAIEADPRPQNCAAGVDISCLILKQD